MPKTGSINLGTDPGFLLPKIEEKNTVKYFFLFYHQKVQSLSLTKDRPSYSTVEAFSSQKRTSSASKTESINYFLFL
jgi:hypothetical protein